jgi:hypothetical protein
MTVRRFPRRNHRHDATRKALDGLAYALAAYGIAVSECPLPTGAVSVDYLDGFGHEAQVAATAEVKFARGAEVSFTWANNDIDDRAFRLVEAHAQAYAAWVR